MEQSNYNSELDSMYAAYKQEFENVHTVYEPGRGFANFKLEKNLDQSIEIYVQEVYVKPHKRGKKTAAELTDYCIAEAELIYDKPVSKIYTTVGIGGNTVDASLRAITAYGFKLLSSNSELIYFYKEITNE
jgi:GNAT superfamily N-acetyltransferase